MTSGPTHLAVSASAPSDDRTGAPAAAPRRLLVVSATIGEGHNATAAAVEEQAARLWPDCEIRRVDTLDAMGRVTGPAFRWIYRVNVDRTPWLYDFFYRELWRRPWFADASCRFTGTWAGRALRPVVERFRPDLVVSTYPLGTGGLDWLRRRGGLDVPVAAIISDFAPHPFWVYSEIDLHYVASEPSLRAMWRARPDARGAVGAPPVVSAFHPLGTEDRASARAALRLPADRPVALISCGSLGFGSVDRAVVATLAAGPEVCVVVACGRNEALRRRLVARGEHAGRLVALGWTNRMPELTAAADVVITNAGGATALEALASSRTVLLFEPIAGHGKANAALMEQAGLCRVCTDPEQLTATVRDLIRTPELLAAAERRAAEHTGGLSFTAEVAALPALPRHRGSRPLAAADALFVGAATAEVPQQVGAIVLLNPAEAAALEPERIAVGLRARLLARAGLLPMLHRRLWVRPGRRPRWLHVDDVDPARHISSRVVRAGSAPAWSEAVREFFDAPLPADRPPWQLQVLRETAGGAGEVLHETGGGAVGGDRTAVLAKLHHSLGDGLAVVATLTGLLADRPAPGLRAVPPAEREHRAGGPRARLARVRRLSRGLLELATAGRAAVGTPRPSSAHRHYALARLPAAEVRATARELGTGTSALLLGLLGEALHRHGTPVVTANDRLRTAVPVTARRVRRSDVADGPGNETAAIMLDLPVGAMPVRRRIVEVADTLDRLGAGQSMASRFTVLALGRLPGALHARLARLVYGGRFFSLIASVLPGWRRELRVLGARVSAVFPVLPLADGVGLAVGYLSWGEVVGVGVTGDSALFPDADGLADTLLEVFAELAGGESAGRIEGLAGRV
jgi:diacylglycerol O-acyltransferase / wax synthase